MHTTLEFGEKYLKSWERILEEEPTENPNTSDTFSSQQEGELSEDGLSHRTGKANGLGAKQLHRLPSDISLVYATTRIKWFKRAA